MKIQQIQPNLNFEAKKRFIDKDARYQLETLLRTMDEETVYKANDYHFESSRVTRLTLCDTKNSTDKAELVDGRRFLGKIPEKNQLDDIVVDKNISVNKKGAIFIFRNDAESEYERLIAVQGVEAEVEYKVSSVDGSVDIERITGAEILSGGLNVSLKDGAMSEIIFIEEADVDFADVKILLFGSELSPLELIAIASVFILIIGIVIVAIIINAEDEYKEKKF